MKTGTRGSPAKKKSSAKKTPTFRPVVRRLDGLGVSFTLPSHWFPVETQQGAGFVSSLYGDREERAYLEVLRIDVPAEQLDEAYARARRSVLGEDDPARLSPVTAPLASGVGTTVESETLRTYVEIYPLASALLRVRVQGVGETFEAAREEYAAVRASLVES